MMIQISHIHQLPEQDLARAPYHLIIAKKQEYFYCRLHLEIKNAYLESIEHHIEYKGPAEHKSELLKCPEITHEYII